MCLYPEAIFKILNDHNHPTPAIRVAAAVKNRNWNQSLKCQPCLFSHFTVLCDTRNVILLPIHPIILCSMSPERMKSAEKERNKDNRCGCHFMEDIGSVSKVLQVGRTLVALHTGVYFGGTSSLLSLHEPGS